MSIQFRKNVIIFCGALVLRTALVTIEVFFNFTGFALHAVYAILTLSLFVFIWLVNRPLVAEIKSKVLQFLSCSAIALLLTGLFVLATAVQGTLFKTLIKGSF
ncbi:MAG: hypothetical protein KAT47_04860 [Candidatus Aegiribacteria sp.]|nr:hypothetical protein [Candidatus Aegiribacteria sp.]